MKLVFVSAAFRRYDVTRLALAQRAHLCGELAERGIEATAVIVADDENLDIAAEFGFAAIERDNAQLGRKFNDGLEYACVELEADYVVLIGSDDWMHADLFDRLPLDVTSEPVPTDESPVVMWSDAPEAITGREIVLVDLASGRLRRCRARGRYGVIPWIFPRLALLPSGFRPIKDALNIGIDGSLIAGLNCQPEWVFTDPHDLCRVDFKSDVNLNGYEQITGAIGYGEEQSGDDVWITLMSRYPSGLVVDAQELSDRMRVQARVAA